MPVATAGPGGGGGGKARPPLADWHSHEVEAAIKVCCLPGEPCCAEIAAAVRHRGVDGAALAASLGSAEALAERLRDACGLAVSLDAARSIRAALTANEQWSCHRFAQFVRLEGGE